MFSKAAKVWVITDGKIGDDVQCLAIAQALDPAFEKRVVSPRAMWAMAAPWGPIDPKDAATTTADQAVPDIVVASGRRAIPYGRAIKKRYDAKLVILKDPRFGRGYADFIWAPIHDKLDGVNVFSTMTSPHGLRLKLDQARAGREGMIAELPKPLLGVVLGGPSGGAVYDTQTADDLIERLSTARKDFASMAITPSRRTPQDFLERIRTALADEVSFVWDQQGHNPYVDILAHADALVVAGDSHNMTSEALASGVGVYVWKPKGLSGKLHWFIEQMQLKHTLRVFADKADPFETTQIDATADIVAEINRRFN